MRTRMDRKQNVAGRRIAGPRLALTAQTNLLAVTNPRGNLDANLFDVPAMPLHRQRRFAALHRCVEWNRQLMPEIVAACNRALCPSRPAIAVELLKQVRKP